MKFYQFGDENNTVIMLLPGTCCYWKGNFGHVIDNLQKFFSVICVSYDGFDETENSEFDSILSQTVKFLQRRMDKKMEASGEYGRAFMKMLGSGIQDMSFVTKRSIANQFYSDLITPLPMNIDVPGTEIHILYAKKMGEKYKERYLKHFSHPVIHEMDLLHEELLVAYPKEWVRLIDKIIRSI
ncbi:MAG: hypothetical protein ACRC3H_01150 [Lachnospiraceae bacterium]